MVTHPGNIVSRRKGLVRHKGLVVGEDAVLHNTPERGEHISSLEAFADGQPVDVEWVPYEARRDALRRARAARARQREYDLFDNNCEHTVTRLVHGRPHSPQLLNWVLGASVGVAVLALSRSPTWALAAAAAFAKVRED